MTKPLQMAQFNMPKTGNAGENLSNVHAYIGRMLAQEFGGFTAFDGYGAWIDPADNAVYSEPVFVYQIAMENVQHNAATLRAIAIEAGQMANQKAVFVQLPSGRVEIIELV